MNGREEVILICDVCQQKQTGIGEHSLSGLTEAERFPAMQKVAEAAGWSIRREAMKWRVICPTCLAEEKRLSESLAPFSGCKATCPKCSGRPVKVQYLSIEGRESLRRTCNCCGYAWSEATARKRPWWKFW